MSLVSSRDAWEKLRADLAPTLGPSATVEDFLAIMAGGIGQRFIHTQFMEPGPAFEMEFVQEVCGDVPGRGDEIIVPRNTIAVNGRGATAIRQERRSQPHVGHVSERRTGDVSAVAGITVFLVRAVGEHGDAVADQLDMAQAVEGPQLLHAVEIIVVER